MKTDLDTLFDDLMALCESNEAFYFVDQKREGVTYRVFTYRLASYTDFQNRNAIECRGHTFRQDTDWFGQPVWILASLPMQKFFNYGEHVGWGTEMDLNTMELVMDKADGSLISTVEDHNGGWFLKSKTSFNSAQAQAAMRLVKTPAYADFALEIEKFTNCGFTVNMEYVAPDNQIVVCYKEEALVVLNIRNRATGEYVPDEVVRKAFPDHAVKSHPIPTDAAKFMVEAEALKGIEGFVIKLANGLMFKHKTEAYCILHHLKDSINSPKRLWEACVMETSDDLRALFKDDPLSIAKIVDMEEKAAKIYSHVHKTVNDFYIENKDLSRKDYAIKGQSELAADGTFSLAMNLYIGREANVKEFLVKNYKKYGIRDEEPDAVLTEE